jgi:hypothetical protein
MTTIDEIGRRAAGAARADAAALAATEVEAGLDRLRLGNAPVVAIPRTSRDPRRWLMLGTAIAVAAAAIIALVINANEGESRRVVPGGSSTQVTTASTSVVSTGAPDTTELTNVTAPAVTTPADAIAVIYLTPPPAYPATPIASVAAPAAPTQMPLVAISDSWIVTVDTVASTATLINRYSPGDPPQVVPLAAGLVGTSVAAGPGDVLYGVVQGNGADMSLDAIALSGDRAGQVVAFAPISAVEFAEAPNGVFGHGADGIIDRRTGKVLLGYVDVTGQPVSIGRAVHTVGTILGEVASSDVVIRDPDGKHDWHLAIQRDPASPGALKGEVPPAPSSHGGAVVLTAVGRPVASTSDIASPTEPVVAVLAADGTGTWYSLADGWQVAASDLDGTILMRRAGNTVELARLDPPQRIDFVNQPAAPHQRVEYAVTLPTTLTSAAPCTIDNLAIAPTTEGAMGTTYGVLSVRNKGSQPCQVAGAPDVALLDDAGNVVQSLDPALLADTSSPPVVLEPDSWATSLLGPIASNVCGGNQSSQFRLTIGGGSATIPYEVSRPFDSQQCDPSNNKAATPGALPVQSFAAVQPNTDGAPAFDFLQVTLDAPATVRAGDVLHYDVVMAAPTSEQSLDSRTCPVYTETLGTASGQFLLNCTSGNGVVVGVGETVRFHVELAIPANATPGATTLAWTPIEPTGTAITTTVTITP